MLGSFENDNPFIEIDIAGVSMQFKRTKAMVDSGYNGYLTLPYVEAFPLGLVLNGIQSSKLADGSLSHHFVCIGTVKCGDKSVDSAIDIYPNCNVLLGTKLLRLLDKTFLMDVVNKKVELVDNKASE
jgi:predicted aspartyl protease